MTNPVMRSHIQRFEFTFYFFHALAVQFVEHSNKKFDVKRAHYAFSFFLFDLRSWDVLYSNYTFDKERKIYKELDEMIKFAQVAGILKLTPAPQNWLWMVDDAEVRCEEFLNVFRCLSDEQRFRAKQCAEWAAYKYDLDVPFFAAVHATGLT